MKNGIKNTDIVIYKLLLTLIRVTNYRLEVIRQNRWKREEMIEKWKVKAIVIKWYRTRGEISLSSKEEDKNNIGEI